MNTQLNNTIYSRVIQNLFYNLATQFKLHKPSKPSYKVRVRLKSTKAFSEWFYPWFLSGGYGKLATHKAICTKRANDSDTFDTNNLSTGSMYIFSDINQIEISGNDFLFKPVGDKTCKVLTKGVKYTLSSSNELKDV